MKKIFTLCLMVFAFLATTQTIHAQDEKQSILEENSKNLVAELQAEFNFTENQTAVIQRALDSKQKADRELSMKKSDMSAQEIKDYKKRVIRNFENLLSEVLTEDEYIQFKRWLKDRNDNRK